MREAVIQARFIKQVKNLRLGLAVKVDCASRRGWPDVLFIDNRGVTTYIEFKNEKGRLSQHQRETHDEMFKLGVVVLVLDSITAVDEYIKNIMFSAGCS